MKFYDASRLLLQRGYGKYNRKSDEKEDKTHKLPLGIQQYIRIRGN